MISKSTKRILGNYYYYNYFYYFDDIISVLKYESTSNGMMRTLIVKNISKCDAATYYCEADGVRSRVSCKLTVCGAAEGVTAGSEPQFAVSKEEMQKRKNIVDQLRKKDMESKKWIKCPDCWCAWMVNPRGLYFPCPGK